MSKYKLMYHEKKALLNRSVLIMPIVVSVCVLFVVLWCGPQVMAMSKISLIRTVKSLTATKEDVEIKWDLTLVNAENRLPTGFVPELRAVDQTRFQFDVRAADALERMLDDSRKEGLRPMICSAYRDIETQEKLFAKQTSREKQNGYSEKKAQEVAAQTVMYPGASEHNLGLAVDIVSEAYQLLDEGQEKTAEYLWLLENCSSYGFILRYPNNKKDITNVIYEPWHFRYVGEENAKLIQTQGICLEEFVHEKAL